MNCKGKLLTFKKKTMMLEEL